MSKIEEEDGALLDEMASKFCKCLVEWWKPRGMGRAIDVNTIVSFLYFFLCVGFSCIKHGVYLFYFMYLTSFCKIG